jgi:hypothetical protein
MSNNTITSSTNERKRDRSAIEEEYQQEQEENEYLKRMLCENDVAALKGHVKFQYDRAEEEYQRAEMADILNIFFLSLFTITSYK